MSGTLQGEPGQTHEHSQSVPNPLPVTDEELLLRYRDHGDDRAFSDLIHRYEGELYSYLRRRLGDAELAQDTFQTTFLQVHLKVHLFDADKKFKPWVYAIALNQAIDCQRRNKRHRMISLDQPGRKGEGDSASLAELSASEDGGPSDELHAEERKLHVREAVDSLPDAQKIVVELIYYQGLKYHETAEVLDVPIGTVKSRCNAAMTKLGEVFGRMELFRK